MRTPKSAYYKNAHVQYIIRKKDFMNKETEYSHGYNVTFTYGDRNLKEILKRLILHDIDSENMEEYNNNTSKTFEGDKNGKDE